MSSLATLPTHIKKRMIEYLPAIYQDSQETAPGDGPSFLSRFLLVFERLLLDGDWEKVDLEGDEGQSAFEEEPLERKISRLHLYLNPGETPEELLSWLAGWAALTFPPELSVARRRKLLAAMLPLYGVRGTRAYLQEILHICVDAIPAVADHEQPAFKIGTHSHVGSDTYIEGGPPHFFRVRLIAPKLNAAELETQRRLAIGLIEISKPAHTYYELEVISRSMQVGVFSTVGQDTILGKDTILGPSTASGRAGGRTKEMEQ